MIICPNCGEENPERFRLCGFCGAQLAPAAPAAEVRKTVTIVFSDLKGSTSMGEALDSEALREVLARYFDEMRSALERHGGTVEKYIGDAVMAIFGLPRLREDDALRAVRAAADMQEALARLNGELEERWGVTLANRTGVNTGEVVAGDPALGQRLVTGDAVNIAARLEQAAPAMEVLIGEPTYRLVKDAIQVEPVEPLDLKGKAERVPAYKLVAVHGDEGVARHGQSPLVGRRQELELLIRCFEEAVVERNCRLVAILGDPGIGKSRLTEEFLRSVAARARVLRGRCLSYGEGVTFWPLVAAVREAAGIRDEDSPATASAKVADLAGDNEAVTERIVAAIGLSEEQFPIEELFWGIRKLFARLAEEKPLVVQFDDIHWAAPTFLDLIEHLLESVEGFPLLLVCPARHTVLEARPGFGQQPSASLLELEALSGDEAELVLHNLLGEAGLAEEARAQIVSAAEGNPLFVEQLLSMLIDDGSLRLDESGWVPTRDLSTLDVPPTINALLASRLDGLPRDERAVIEPASVVGFTFQEPAVSALVPDELADRVPANLVVLTGKHFVRPDPTTEEEFRMYRFDHILIRDAAYQGLLKRARATLHERFVEWADQFNRATGREMEYEEILGYHLEQAYLHLSELGPLDDHGRELGRRGAERLASAGLRAFARGDMAATVNLLDRASSLLPKEDPRRLELMPDLGEALTDLGDFARAETLLNDAIAAATAIGDSRLGAHVRLTLLLVKFFADPEGWGDQVLDEAMSSIAVFEASDDKTGLAKAWRLVEFVHGRACRFAEQAEAGRRAMAYARLAGDRRQETRSSTSFAISTLYGTTPVPEAIEECERIVDRIAGDRRAEGLVRSVLAPLYAMRGDFERGRKSYRTARALLDELGKNVLAASVSYESHAVELLAGDPAAAETELRHDYEILEAMGERYLSSGIAALLAQAVYAQGRAGEAQSLSEVAEASAAEDDPQSQACWRCVRAKLLADAGRHDEARLLASEATELLARTDALPYQADALVDQAHVFARAGAASQARSALEEALRLYESKGNTVAAERVRSVLAEPADQAIA